MSDMTDYLEGALANHVFLGTPYTAPATVYLALYTVLPGEDGTGGTEVTGGSYARQALTLVAGTTTGSVKNSGVESFGPMPAATVVGVGLLDASTAGNLLARKTLPASVTYASGDTATLADGALTFTFA